jgi:hypothetical protein
LVARITVPRTIKTRKKLAPNSTPMAMSLSLLWEARITVRMSQIPLAIAKMVAPAIASDNFKKAEILAMGDAT